MGTTPPERLLPDVRISGVTSNSWQANILPVLATPVRTSSNIRSTWCSSQISRTRWRKAFVGTTIPAVLQIGSSITAAIVGVFICYRLLNELRTEFVCFLACREAIPELNRIRHLEETGDLGFKFSISRSSATCGRGRKGCSVIAQIHAYELVFVRVPALFLILAGKLERSFVGLRASTMKSRFPGVIWPILSTYSSPISDIPCKGGTKTLLSICSLIIRMILGCRCPNIAT